MTLNHNNYQYPLSSSQREVWFDQILHPEVPLYNIGGYMRIEGPIDSTLFEKALNQVIQENDALRIILHEGEPLPIQTFEENIHIKLDYYDFAAKEQPFQAALVWMKQEFAKPFQLYENPLFQYALFKISDLCYILFGKYHHLIMDGWSISLNAQYIATAYNALLPEQSVAQPKCYSYLDFVKNDIAYLESEKFAKAERYWLEKYRELPSPLILRRYATNFTKKIIPSRLSMLLLKRELYNRLIALAQENQVSTFHVILGVLYCYFVRTSDSKDFVIGLPTLNRRTATFKQTVGLFVSVSPAWFRFGTDLSFVELIQAISLELQKDYRHQRFPISEINKQVGLHKEGRRQLFDITLSYEKHDYDTHFNGNPAFAVNLMNGFEQNALAIFIREFHGHEDVRMDFEYNLGASQDDEIERIKARFEFLLAEILRKPSKPLFELQLMPEAEYQKIVLEFNDTKRDYPRDKTIVNLFEEQVEKTPHNVAVVFEGQQLSYQALNEKANQLAHYLQTLGIKLEMLVGLCLERSIEMIIGLLGILKAGGAYVPLDPSYPSERLAFMLEDS